jgi:hypothetical protein
MSEKSKKADQSRSLMGDAGEAEVQARYDQAQEQGYEGVVADPTPNSAYTLGGVVSGEPTPETDAAAARDAEQHLADISAPKFPEGGE